MQENENIKFITGDPKKAIQKLAYPLVISMLLQMLNNLVDSIWVAGLGAEPLAALGFITPLYLVLIGIGNGIGGGVNSLLSRLIGAKKTKDLDNAAIHSIFLSIIVCVIITLFFTVFLKDLLYIMGAGEVISYGMDYGYILFLGSFAILLPGIYGGIFRSEGDIKKATVPIAVTAIINIILDPIFIYVLNFGIKGAAIATVLASLIALILMLYWMFVKKDSYFSYDLKNFRLNFSMYKDILNVGIPASLEEILMSAVSIIINFLIQVVAGTTAVAVFTAGWRLLAIAIMPTIAVATASITVAGVAYGARNVKNIQIATRYSIKLGFIFSVIIAIIFIVFADQIAYLFSYSANSADLAGMIADFLRLMWIYVLPVAFGSTAGYVFQGLGKGITSFILTMLRELICAVICAYIFAITLNLGLLGVYIGLIVGTVIGSAIGVIYVEFYIKKLKEEFDGVS